MMGVFPLSIHASNLVSYIFLLFLQFIIVVVVAETVGIRVANRNIRNLVAPSRHSPSDPCISAANAVYKFTGIFRNLGLEISYFNLSIFLLFIFFLCCLITAVYILAELKIGRWLLSSARK
jgi:ABC-type transport system involved in cytochrome c biogenesis permease subunit